VLGGMGSSQGSRILAERSDIRRQVRRPRLRPKKGPYATATSSPSNLLLDLRGTVWVTDFGLAKVSGPARRAKPPD